MNRILLGLLLLALVYTLYFAKDIIVIILLALFLATLLHPVVRFLHRHRIPKSIGAGAVVLFLSGVLVTAGYQLSGPAAKWLDQGPQVLNEIKYKLFSLQETIKDAQETTEKLEEMTQTDAKQERVVVEGPSLSNIFFNYAKSLLINCVILILLLYFFLGFGSFSFLCMSPDASDSCTSSKRRQYPKYIQDEVSMYIQTLSLINLGLGICISLLMTVLGMPNPILWGVLTVFFNFIPYLGAAVMAVILGIVSFISFNAWLEIVLPPLVYLALTTLEGDVVRPLIMGRKLDLNPLMVFLSLVFWGWLWGPVGVFLAVPLLIAFKVLVDQEESLAFFLPLIKRP